MFTNDSLSNRSHHKEKDGRYGSLHHRIPYRLLGRRSMGTKRLVLSSKVLLSAIPTHNCDVVLTFPANTEDSTLMWLLARLKSRKPALTVSVRHHSHSGIYGFYLTADYDSLLQGAEELALLKPLKTEYGGGMKEFVFEDQDCFAGVEDEETFLTSQERQSIVLQFLNDLRATGDDSLKGVEFVESQPIIPLLKTNKIISQVFPLHNSNDLKELRQTWVQALFSPQPLDLVCRYFGVKIALYFAYLGHYTVWLIIPAFFGLFIFLLQGTDQFMEDVCFLFFTFFNVIWASLYLKFWSRASTEFSYRMGTLEKKDDLLKDPRPLFKGQLMKSPVTGHLEPTYPGWKRSLFFYTITVPVVCLCLLFVFITMLLCFELQEWVNDLIASADLPYVFSFGPKILLAVVVSIMDEFYKQIAIWLTHKENYRLEESFETNLVIKLVSFQFVNSFLSLFYIGFYLGDMDRLRDQLAALLITRQVLGNIKEALMPYVMWKAKLYSFGYRIATRMSPASVEKEVRKMTGKSHRKRSVPCASVDKDKKLEGKNSDEESSTVTTEEEDEGIPSLTQAEVESAMKKYEDTLDDYLEMCIQFGYITLFSSAFPLAALCALINNIIEIRSDAFKLCLTYQRPFGKRVENIGIWQDVLLSIGILAVIVNCILMGTTGLLSRLWPGLTPTTAIVVLVIIEHLTIALKAGIERSIPDMPQTICTEMAKLEYQRREALKQLESQAPPLHSLSQQQPFSPSINRKRVADGNTALSSSVNQISPSVITPSSFTPRPSDISLTSSTKIESQSILPPPDAAKPEIPPRTSLLNKDGCSAKPQVTPCLPLLSSSSPPLSSSLSSSAHTDVAEKVVAAVIHPVIDNFDKKNTSCTSGSGLHQLPRVQLRPRVKPVISDDKDMESVGRRYLRRRLDFHDRRGMSDPVSSAVSMALNLHEDRDAGKRSIALKDDGSGAHSSPYNVHAKQNTSDLLESSKERRQDLLRRSLQNIAQREELRRTSSLKHTRRAGDKTICDSSDLTSYPPPTMLTSSMRFSSPSRLARLKAGTYSSQISLGKQRSLSSENVNEPSFSWRDRHSWKAEGSSSSTSKPPKTSRPAPSNDSGVVSHCVPVSVADTNTSSDAHIVTSKPPSGLVEGKSVTQQQQSPPEIPKSESGKSGQQGLVNLATQSPKSLRAVRDGSNQPLSISAKNLKPK